MSNGILLKGRSKRDIEQALVANLLEKANFRGSVLAGTGFGKTRVMWKAALKAWRTWKGDERKKILILVPFDHLKDRFKDELMSFTDKEERRDAFWNEHVEAHCYASISKLDPEGYSVVVGDEAQFGMTDMCHVFFSKVKGPLMFCTATEPEDPIYRNRLHQLAPVVYSISLDECVEREFVAPYRIRCIAVDLTPEESALYGTVNRNFGHWKNKLGFDAFNMAQGIMKHPKAYPKEDMVAAVGFYRAIRQRKELIDMAHNKISKTVSLLEDVDGRALVFGGNVAFVEKLAKAIPQSQMYHSKNGVKNNRKALSEFKSGVCKRLVSVKALNQGLDVPNAAHGIVCGLTSKVLTMIQRLGRFVRIDATDPDKTGFITIVYVKDSQEEKWLRNALKSTDPSRISWE